MSGPIDSEVEQPVTFGDLTDADAPLTEREKYLMLALWSVVKASGGRVRVNRPVSAAYREGVSMLDCRVCPVNGAMIYEVVA